MGERVRIWFAIITFLTLLIGGAVTFGQTDEPVGRLSAPQRSLVQRARAEGQIWVIVRLNTPYALPQASPQTFHTNRTHYQQMRHQIYDALQAEGSPQRAPMNFTIHANAQNWYVPYTALLVDARALRQLFRLPLVADVQESELSAPTLDTSLPVIGADFAHAGGFTGAGQTVAILDTGIEAQHPFFQDSAGFSRVSEEACFSTNQGAPIRALCPNETPSEIGPGAASPNVHRCQANGQNMCIHGTHVAGIAAGRAGSINGATLDGVAPDAEIVAVQVFSRVTGTACGSGLSPCVLSFRHNQIDGLNHVLSLVMANVPVAAVNMSLGNSANNNTACDQDARKAMIDALLVWDVATVISSGNSGHRTGVGAPACISSAVTVSAVRDNLNVPGFANTGDLVDLFAPGVNIWSSVPGAAYANFNGTSMAAPHVTGAWAVMKAVQPLGVAEIQTHLHNTGSPVGGVTVTARSINLNEAIQELVPPPHNDHFVNAHEIPTGSFGYQQDTTWATVRGDDPQPACAPTERTVWFQHTATQNTYLQVDTFGSDFDTVMAVWTRTGDLWNVVACSDDVIMENPSPPLDPTQSRAVFEVSPGTTYWIMVGGKVGSVSYGALSIQAQPLPYTPSSITAFYLINADTDKTLRQLIDGDTVNLFDIGTNNINVVAVTNPKRVGSVVFGLKDDTQNNPRFRVELGTPYALAGDKNKNYFAWNPVVGKRYTVTATPYSQIEGKRTQGEPGSVTFDVIDLSNQTVESLTLINADTDQPIEVLTDGQVIDLANYPTRNLNIRADTNPGRVGSVVFSLPDNPRYRVENGAPYALGGSNDDDIVPWGYELKEYQLTVTTYTRRGGRGSPGTPYPLTFSITDSAAPTINQDGLRQIAPP